MYVAPAWLLMPGAARVAGRISRLADESDEVDESIPARTADDEVARREVLADLLQRGIESGKLVESDRDLLLDLAHGAEQINAPGRRGRGGLMTPSVTQLVEEAHSMSSHSIRRRAAGAIKAMRDEAEHGHLAM